MVRAENHGMHRAAVCLTACLAAVLAACAPAELSLTVDAADIPADGLTIVPVLATLTPSRETMVSFEMSGVGLLATTSLLTDRGSAAAAVIAPLEEELVGSSFTSTLVARAIIDEQPVEATAELTFVVPTTGAPILRAFAEGGRDRVVAGSGDSIAIVVEGVRVASSELVFEVDNDVVTAPAATALVDGRAVVAIRAPAEPANVTLTVRAGELSTTVVLRFIAEGAATFDLTGTFAQITYGVTQIDDFFLLDGAPQCTVAASLALVRIVQDGAHLEVTTETCTVEMPGVKIVGMGNIVPTVGDGFVRAANDAAGPPLSFDLGNVGDGASFSPPLSAHTPLIVGAVLANASDALPTSANDARIVDADGDGRPGVTVFTGNDAQETCYRTRVTSMSGTIDGNNSVTGELESVTESVVLNSAFGSIGPRMTGKTSPFVMVRVDGAHGAVNIAARDGDASRVSCADVRAYADELKALTREPNARTACR